MALNFNSFAIIDFESGGLGAGLQPLSIGVVILDARRLTIADNGIFYSLMKPIPPEECPKYGLDPVSPEALAKNKLDPKELENAPTCKKVWGNLINFMKYHNIKGDKWSAPIFTGWNTLFDYQIAQRLIYGHLSEKICLSSKLIPKTSHKEVGEKELAKAYKELKLLREPYGFGGETIFRPFPVIDVAQNAFMLFESLREPEKLNLGAVMEFLGFPTGGTHNALVDCLWTTEIFSRYLRLFRSVAQEVDYNTEGKTTIDIQHYISKILHTDCLHKTSIVEEPLQEAPF